jgi:hypothetical protein
VLEFLDGETLGYAIKVPLWKWLGVREKIAARPRWERVSDSIDGFVTTLELPRWDRTQRVVVYRKRVFHETQKNFQLDLFSPDDGHFEYSAVATNTALGVAALWHFMAGRGGHEKTLGELKQHPVQQAVAVAIPPETLYAAEALVGVRAARLGGADVAGLVHLGDALSPRADEARGAHDSQPLGRSDPGRDERRHERALGGSQQKDPVDQAQGQTP